jgi:hypothetical protein
MIFTVRDGKPVIILVCQCCAHSVLVRLPARWEKCARCGERVDVPEGEKTSPA